MSQSWPLLSFLFVLFYLFFLSFLSFFLSSFLVSSQPKQSGTCDPTQGQRWAD